MQTGGASTSTIRLYATTSIQPRSFHLCDHESDPLAAIPARISQGTAPRLFAVKKEALRRLGRYNDQFTQFVTVSISGLAQALPFGTVGHVVPLKQMFPGRLVTPRPTGFAKAQTAAGVPAAPPPLTVAEHGSVGFLDRAQVAPITAADRGTPAVARAVGSPFVGAVTSEALAAERRVVSQIVDTIEERSAERAINDPAFMAALDRGRKGITDAGTRFHNIAKEESRLLVKDGKVPANYQVVAEHAIGSGSGSSRLDLQVTTPSGRPFEVDWKTSVLSGLARNVRESEMPKHALAVRLLGVELAGQESRSWGPAIVRMLRRVGRLDSLTPGQLKALAPWL